jgi:hypothetical protein
METTTSFDLNIALQHWLERLGQSPQVKAENLKELESHVRDSVVQLQSKGLSSEESFFVATHRAGSPTKLESEFGKVNRNPLDLVIHGLILVFFSVGCFFLWALLRLPPQMQGGTLQGRLPGFTQMVMDWGSYLIVPPIIAACYCIYVWVRKSGRGSSWMGFFASIMAVLFFMTLPILFAIVLPVIFFMQTQSH